MLDFCDWKKPYNARFVYSFQASANYTGFRKLCSAIPKFGCVLSGFEEYGGLGICFADKTQQKQNIAILRVSNMFVRLL